jgi:cell fate (sporulation/competence/biofilm development) regulator YlbF (YheA/YmcA/DUF963 family)
MDILVKAKELGEMIAESPEMKRLKTSEIDLDADSKATTLMSEYKNLQIQLVRASKEKKATEAINLIKASLMAKQQELYDYEITNNYLEAKSDLDSLMKNINDVITFAITGEDPCSPSKCSSCSGCK